MRLSLTFALLTALQVVVAEAAPIRTPYARQAPLAIHRVDAPAGPVRQYDCVELVVALGATYDNPFDPEDVAVDARVTGPDGKTFAVPGFLSRPFDRKLEHGREVLTPAGEPSWHERFTPPTPGDYSVVVVARDRTGQCESQPVRIRAQASDDPGFVRVSPRDGRYFEFDNGKAYYPVGLNICWSHARRTFDYDDWLHAFGQAGCTSTRLWLAPDWVGLALEQTGKPEQGLGMGQINLVGAWRLDHVLDLARREGLYVKLCFDSFNILREKQGYNYWERTPHNAANGGPLHKPKDFWTDPAMDRFYRNKLRYLVARYGCLTHVLSWEFWNEADIVTNYDPELSRVWHERMGRYLRSIDPYHHLVTTSFARSAGDPPVDGLKELDYVQTHLYGGADPVERLTEYQRQKETFGKPHYVGEFGASSSESGFAKDPNGLQVHDSLWASVACGGSGTAQCWYWESIHAHSLHPMYTAVARFTSGVDWPAEQMKRVEPACAWGRVPEPMPRKDLVLKTLSPSWKTTEWNRPRTYSVDRSGLREADPLEEIQYSSHAHKDKHNPVRMEVDLPWATQFGVNISGVSGYGGAKLVLRLDGKAVLEKDFADTNPPGKHETLKQYNGWYGVDVPPGKHVVELENVGTDWFLCNYLLRDGLECHQPPLLAWATAGRTTALAWVRLEGRSWAQVCSVGAKLPPCPASVLQLPGLASGRWRADLWDTWAGRIVQQSMVAVASDGIARVPLPEIATDLGVRLRREP